MVLPTLQSYSATKHLKTTPDIIPTKPEIEADRKIEKAPARLNSAQSKWASPISGTLNDEALRDEQEKQEKLKRLERRRSHLSEVLEAEKSKHQNDLTSIRQSSREKDRQVMTNDKSSDSWTSDNLELDSIEELRLENFQVDHRPESLNEKHLDRQEEEERQTERQIRIVQLKLILQRQMNEFKQKEEESESLEQEEECLLREQNQLEQYEEERKQMEKPPVQQDSSRQLLRQHKAKLHKRAKEIQEQLEFDIKILASVVHADKGTRWEQSEDGEKFRRDALKMLKQFEQQLKFEKDKEQEFDAMYPDEAAKQWSHHEQEWSHEKESREKLIQQLLHERQEQILSRLQMIKKQAEETYEKQRILIADMEQARKYHLIEKQKQAKETEENRKVENLQSRLELDKHHTMEDDRNKRIDRLEQKPKSVISDTTIEPKFYGRRRVNWN